MVPAGEGVGLTNLKYTLRQAMGKHSTYCMLCLSPRHRMTACPRFLFAAREALVHGKWGAKLSDQQMDQITEGMVQDFASTYADAPGHMDGEALNKEIFK